MNVAKTNQKGFSIIEVVLVLAIAGLIFLMVFVALPALQRSQRDQARRSDVGVVGAAVSSYLSNNRGALPNTANLQGYVSNMSNYTTNQLAVTPNAPANLDQIHVSTGVKCGANGAVTAASSRNAVVRVRLEAGGGSQTGVLFCQDV